MLFSSVVAADQDEEESVVSDDDFLFFFLSFFPFFSAGFLDTFFLSLPEVLAGAGLGFFAPAFDDVTLNIVA